MKFTGKLICLLIFFQFCASVFAQRDTVFVPPAFKFSVEKDKWVENIQLLPEYGSISVLSPKNNSKIKLRIQCTKARPYSNSPESMIKSYAYVLEESKIKFQKKTSGTTTFFRYKKKDEENQSSNFYINYSVYNNYYLADFEISGPVTFEKEIEKILEELIANSTLLLPADIDKLEGYPFKPEQRDNLIKLGIAKEKKRYAEISSETEDEITEAVTKDIDNKINYQYTTQLFFEYEEKMLTGNIPIDEILDYLIASKEGNTFSFYKAFGNWYGNEWKEIIDLKVSKFLKQQFAKDTTMGVENLHGFLAIPVKSDSIYWSLTVLFDETTRNNYKKKLNDSVDVLVKQRMRKTGNKDTLQVWDEVFETLPPGIYEKKLNTKDTLVIICCQKNKNGEWKLSPTKFGVTANRDDFYSTQDYSSKDTVGSNLATGNFVIYYNRAFTFTFIGNNKNAETNFIPVRNNFDSLLGKYSVLYPDFSVANYKNYDSRNYVSQLSDSISTAAFLSQKINSMLEYNVIMKNKDLKTFVDTSLTNDHTNVEAPSKHYEKKVVKNFTVNYLKSIPPEERIYVSKLFLNRDVDNDGVNEIFQVTYSNGIILDLIIIQKTETGVMHVTGNKELENKILNLTEIKWMKQVSLLKENVLHKKYYGTRD